MRKIIECVPNISEGKDGGIIKAVCDAVSAVKGVKLLHVTSHADHNRSVLTFKGSPRAVGAAAVALAVKAAELIDLTKQKGEHPRMGAADVIPFVPLRGATMEDCVSLSKRVGKRIWLEAGVPVFLYEYAATAMGPRRAVCPSLLARKIEVGPSAPPMMAIAAAALSLNPMAIAMKYAP